MVQTYNYPFTLSEARSAESKGAASLLLILLAACGSAADPPPPDDPEFPPPPSDEGLQLVATVHIEPGAEQLSCRYMVLPDSPLEIARFEHRYTPGSHHLLIYPTDLSPSDVVDDEPFDCLTRGDLHATGVLYGGMEPTGDLPYPAGVAMKLPPNSVVLLETHYLNATDAPLDAVARVNLWFSTTPATIEAGTLFFRDWALYLPPSPAEATASMHCALPSSISLLYATSHMHRRGVAFTSTATSPSGPIPLHDADTWSAPTPTVYWPPLDLPAGTSIDFTCDYVNDLSSPVIEGVSATTDEMCVLVGGYWPKLPADAELCLGPSSGPVLAGTETCEQVVSCMLDAGVGNWLGGQQCVANTCASSASALSSFVVCVNRNDCWGDPTCVAAQCPSQWDACAAAACD